jgi:hypothetical protein
MFRLWRDVLACRALGRRGLEGLADDLARMKRRIETGEKSARDEVDLGRALVRDVVERQAATVSVRGSGEDGALVRVDLGGAE